MFKDKDRRRGLITTLVVHALLLLLFMFFGLQYMEPKPEDGIIINFGNSETGIGDQADGAPQVSEAVPPTEVQSETPQETTPSNETPQTLTQDMVDAPAIKKEEKREEPKPKKTEEKPREPTPEELEQKQLAEERAEKQRQLAERFGKVSDAKAGGEGEKKGPGDQGSPDGDPNSPNRTGGATGGGGGGGSGNYLLGNRQALMKPRPEYNCADEGRVVVKIYVDRNGSVTSAVPGEKIPGGTASTTTSGCLYDKAKAAALRTTWEGDSEAPAMQVGYIIYNFQKQ